MDRYAREVSPTKRGMRWEQIRLEKFKTYPIADVAMSDLRASDFAAWRDARLKEVSASSVNKEMYVMSAVLSQARKEWGLIKENPLADVKKSAEPPPRDRRVSQNELERLALSAGADLTKSTARTFHAFLFAIETGMRIGEILNLSWENVDIETQVCHLPITKNGTARDVPLSQEAVRLLKSLPWAGEKEGSVFRLSTSQVDSLWRKLRDRAGVKDLHFHDSRHEAITRLARKLDVLSLARTVGHRNLNELMTYYNELAADLAKRLG